jgi:hypothetical protein
MALLFRCINGARIGKKIQQEIKPEALGELLNSSAPQIIVGVIHEETARLG